MDKKRISQEEFDKAVEQHNKYVEDAEQGEEAIFKDVFFEKIDMSDKQLNGASFENCYFKECDLKDIGLCFSEIKGCLFDRCNAKQLAAEEAKIKDTTFEKCDMTKSHFTHSSFDDVRFIECDIMDISFQYALGEVEINPERKKPRCKLVGSDGNIYALLGVASRALKNNGQREDAENMRERVFASGSYYEALGIITEYVDDESMHRVFAYLIKQRFIDSDVIAHFAKAKTLYEDKEHHNAVFVGLDENGIPRQASKRSTSTFGKTFRITIEGSDTAYSFSHFGESNKLFVFEAPIDMLSFITLHKQGWEKHSYIAMNGVYESAVLKALESHKNLDRIYLCTDNDEGGIDAAYRLKDILNENGYTDIYRVTPEHKDFNEDLKAKHGAEFIPAERYKRFDKVLEISDDLNFYRCVPERLLSRLQATVKNEQYEYLAEYALAGSAFFASRHRGEENERDMFEKLRSKLKAEYKPYSDKGFRHGRISDLNRCMKEVTRDLGLHARTREQEINTAEKLFRLAESAVKLAADISLSEPEVSESDESQDEGSYDFSSGYG